MVTRYQKRISGPLLDRIDIHADVPRVEFDKLADDRLGERSSMGPSEVRIFCGLDESGRSLVRQAMTQLQLTARAFHRVLKLARTIADLSGDEEIVTQHLAEALQYRPRRWT
jgi:magnesium chelatase family protein